MKHVIDISAAPAKLSIQNHLLCLQTAAADPVTVPVHEVGALILSNGQVTCTQATLTELALAGATVISCDGRHMPAAMLMPLFGYHAPARRLAAQVDSSQPTRKRAWQQIVRAKILAQASVLVRMTGSAWGLVEMARQVASGDPENLEGQASRIYWPKLFGEEFRRDFDSEDENRYLNYGYAIIRGIVARAICGVGLHPGIGVHHHHRENAFCLADDLMEPLRYLVDLNVLEFVRLHGNKAPMDRLTKAHLLSVAETRVLIERENRGVFEVAEIMASSLGQTFEGVRQDLLLPDAPACSRRPPVEPSMQ